MGTDVSELTSFVSDVVFSGVLTTFGVHFCEDFCTLGHLDLPALHEFSIDVSEVSPLAQYLGGLSCVLATFDVLFCEDFCTLGSLDLPIYL